MLLKFQSFGPLDTNGYLLACEATRKAAVIDVPADSVAFFIQEVQKHHLILENIFLTHSHWDHFADAHALVQKTQASLWIHPLDAPNLQLPGADHLPLFFEIHSIQPTHFYQEGAGIQIGQLEGTVLHTPGHSPGGVCLYFPKEGILFSGDTLFQGTIGNLNLPTANPTQMWSSLETLSKLPPQTEVFPGHGPQTTLQKEGWLHRAREIFGE